MLIFNKFKTWKATLKKARELNEEKRQKDRWAKKLYNIALAFNDAHTHTRDDLWMCPICNEVHKRVKSSWDFMTGAHYPACCNIEAHHRLFYDIHATTGNYRKEIK